MKAFKVIGSLFLLLSLSSFMRPSLAPIADDGYKITVKINGVKDTFCLLANYYGDKQYIKDTGWVNSDGVFTLKGANKWDRGIYLVVTPAKKYFEVILTEDQEFSMETDTTDLIKNMKVKGSEENELFYEYQNYISKKHSERQPLMDEMKADSTKEEAIKEKLKAIDKEVQSYKDEFSEKHPNTFVAKIFKAMKDVEIPEAPILENGRKDSTFAYRYLKKHFFDNIDFSDDGLLRTPLFHKKVKYYLDKMTPQHPDSIIVSADFIIEKAKANNEMFKYVVFYVTYTYETSKIMCMDEVFVHMAKTYYATNQAFWVDSTQNAKIVARGKKLSQTLCDEKAPELIMPDTTMKKMYSLHNVDAKYTVLVFWDHDCGHCKKEIPILKEIYKEYKSKGLEIYGVEITNKVEKWKEALDKFEIDWINVADLFGQNKFREKYDIYSTPVIFLLDENKVIKAKRIGAEQVRKFMEQFLDEKEEK